jgi:hypothetical protein
MPRNPTAGYGAIAAMTLPRRPRAAVAGARFRVTMRAMTATDFAGKYASAEITVELRAVDGGLGGEILLRGQRLPLRAAVHGDHIEGTFAANGAEFPFHGRMEGPHLRLMSGGAEYVLPVAAQANPLAELVPAAPAAPPAAPASRDGQLFRHPTGGQFKVPPGWSALPTSGGVQLVPPGSGFNAAGPTEVYAVTSEQAPAIEAADDPRVLAYLDQSLAQMIPNVQRAGPPEPLGPGIRVRYHAKNPITGGAVDVVSMVTLLRGMAVGVIGIADPAALASRLPALEGVFTSLAWGEGDQDPALVGVWHHWAYSSSGPATYTGSFLSAETRQVIELAADGTAAMRAATETSASLKGRDSQGATTFTAGMAGQRGTRRMGTWSAGDGRLYLIWADGTSTTGQYQVSGPPGDRRVTLLAPGAAKPIEWTERPVEV